MTWKATRKYADNLSIEVTAEDQVELFKKLAAADDVWLDLVPKSAEPGQIKMNIRRTSDDSEYFEVLCVAGPLAGIKKKISLYKNTNKGMLYHKKTVDDGEEAFPRGWVKYVGTAGDGVSR